MNHTEYMRAIIDDLFKDTKSSMLCEVITPKQAVSFIDREQTQEVMTPGNVRTQHNDRTAQTKLGISILAKEVAERIDYALSHDVKAATKRHENDTVIIRMAVHFKKDAIAICDDDKYIFMAEIHGGDAPTPHDVMRAAMNMYQKAGWQVKLEPGRQAGEYVLHLEANGVE